jgi:hypothetical protein
MGIDRMRDEGATMQDQVTAGRRYGRRGVTAVLAAVLVMAVAAGPARAEADEPSARLVVAGEPLVHTFDLATPGDSVEGEWLVAADAAVAYDGTLLAGETSASVLADALLVEYGEVSSGGAVLGWRDAGTLADSRSYGEALGVDLTTDPAVATRIPVRVSLPDPEPVRAALREGATVLVEATFTVAYLADASPATPGAPAPPGAPGAADVPEDSGAMAGSVSIGALATTGAGLAALGLAAALLVGGAMLARSARRSSRT